MTSVSLSTIQSVHTVSFSKNHKKDTNVSTHAVMHPHLHSSFFYTNIATMHAPCMPTVLFFFNNNYISLVCTLITTFIKTRWEKLKRRMQVYKHTYTYMSNSLTHLTIFKQFSIKYRENAQPSGQFSPSKGLVSIDHSVIAALLFTTPRSRRKSFTIDFVHSHLM